MEQNLFKIFRDVVFLKLRYKNFKWTVATNVKIHLALKFVYTNSSLLCYHKFTLIEIPHPRALQS